MFISTCCWAVNCRFWFEPLKGNLYKFAEKKFERLLMYASPHFNYFKTLLWIFQKPHSVQAAMNVTENPGMSQIDIERFSMAEKPEWMTKHLIQRRIINILRDLIQTAKFTVADKIVHSILCWNVQIVYEQKSLKRFCSPENIWTIQWTIVRPLNSVY